MIQEFKSKCSEMTEIAGSRRYAWHAIRGVPQTMRDGVETTVSGGGVRIFPYKYGHQYQQKTGFYKIPLWSLIPASSSGPCLHAYTDIYAIGKNIKPYRILSIVL